MAGTSLATTHSIATVNKQIHHFVALYILVFVGKTVMSDKVIKREKL